MRRKSTGISLPISEAHIRVTVPGHPYPLSVIHPAGKQNRTTQSQAALGRTLRTRSLANNESELFEHFASVLLRQVFSEFLCGLRLFLILHPRERITDVRSI